MRLPSIKRIIKDYMTDKGKHLDLVNGKKKASYLIYSYLVDLEALKFWSDIDTFDRVEGRLHELYEMISNDPYLESSQKRYLQKQIRERLKELDAWLYADIR